LRFNSEFFRRLDPLPQHALKFLHVRKGACGYNLGEAGDSRFNEFAVVLFHAFIDDLEIFFNGFGAFGKNSRK